jgi:archaellum component FlaF (FlaF/FlaG flagellin family)
MGFSLVAAFAVISISILIAIEIFTGSLLPAIKDVDESYDDLADRTVEMVQTDINISSVSVFSYGLNYNHSIVLKNTGSISLNTSDFTILINGLVEQFSCPDSYLYPEKETYLNVSNLPGDGNKILKVISGNGISDYYEYTI